MKPNDVCVLHQTEKAKRREKTDAKFLTLSVASAATVSNEVINGDCGNFI